MKAQSMLPSNCLSPHQLTTLEKGILGFRTLALSESGPSLYLYSPANESVRQTYIPRAFISIATSSSAPIPRGPIASRKAVKSENAVSRPHRPSRFMYPRFLASHAPVNSIRVFFSYVYLPGIVAPMFSLEFVLSPVLLSSPESLSFLYCPLYVPLRWLS